MTGSLRDSQKPLFIRAKREVVLQTKDNLLHGQTPFTDHTRGVEQDETPHQTQHQMPIVGVFAVHLAGLSGQQMLEGPKHELDPTAPSPPADQLRGTPLGLQTQQVETVLARLIDDDYGHLAIGRTGSAQPHVTYTRLPRMLLPVPPLALDQGVAFDLSPIRQRKAIGRFALY